MERNHAVTATNITHPCSSGSGTFVDATKIQTIVPNSCKERNADNELTENFHSVPSNSELALHITHQKPSDTFRKTEETLQKFSRSISVVLRNDRH